MVRDGCTWRKKERKGKMAVFNKLVLGALGQHVILYIKYIVSGYGKKMYMWLPRILNLQEGMIDRPKRANAIIKKRRKIKCQYCNDIIYGIIHEYVYFNKKMLP